MESTKKEKDQEEKKEQKESVEQPKQSETPKADNNDLLIKELRYENAGLKKEIEDQRKDYERQIFEFVEKKSKEAAKIIADKEKELSDRYKHEFENKKKFIYERQLSELAEIVSQFEKVIHSITNPEAANYLVGFKMFLTKFEDLFSDFGIHSISPKVGDEFDSDTMEATNVVTTDKREMSNKITKVFLKGYRLHERVVKLSSVEVSRFEEKE